VIGDNPTEIAMFFSFKPMKDEDDRLMMIDSADQKEKGFQRGAAELNRLQEKECSEAPI
jgi:hypothetical protein